MAPNNNTTITLQSVVNLASTHVDLLPLANVGGYQNEPALSLCNDVLSDLCFSEIDWDFNRIELPQLVTAANKQDYLFGGACAFTLTGSLTGVGIALASSNAISESGFVVTVNTLEPHRFNVGDVVYMQGNTVAAYNSTLADNGVTTTWSGGWTITATPTPTSFQFTHSQSGLGNSGAPGISDYGWLASASMVNMLNTNSPRETRPLQAVKELQPWSKVANPEKVSVLKDNGDGTLKVRFWYVPPAGSPWGVNLVYQAKPPVKTALGNFWDPFPDHYQAVYRQAFLYRCYRYLNSTRAETEFQKLQQEIQKAQGAQDRVMTDIHVVPEEPLIDNSYWLGTGW